MVDGAGNSLGTLCSPLAIDLPVKLAFFRLGTPDSSLTVVRLVSRPQVGSFVRLFVRSFFLLQADACWQWFPCRYPV